MQRHGVSPRKALGQHFLVDANLTRKIVATARVGPGSQVIEIGAGTGTLTAALAATGARVVAYEIDRRFQPILEETVGGLAQVELRFADATRVEFAGLLDPGDWVLVANLPYHVGTPLILDLLRHLPAVVRMVVMVQLEVAERLAASPGSKRYGLPSIVAGLHSEVRVAFRVPSQVFVPPPTVVSAVVTIERRPASPRAEAAIALAAAAFGQRRKMLRRSLAAAVDPGDLERAGIDPTSRSEDLAPEDYLRLAEVIGG